MKIYVSKAKDPSYYGQVGIRVGKKVSSMNVIYFGKHSELLKEHDDPRAYVKSEIAKWNEENKNRRFFDVKYNLDEKVENVDNEEGESTETNVGYFYLQYIMKDLKLKEYTTTHYKDYEFEYDAFDILRFLVYDRIIDPDSKLAESKELNCYYGNFDFGYYDILRFMDVLVGDEDHKNEESYLKWLYKKSNKIVKRDLTTLYFDGTNFYCETDGPDQYFVDPDTGEILALPRPMRRYGISKEHRPNPIVQMGLFTDTDGIPITMCLSPGNTAECTTAIPLEEQVCDMLQDDKTDFVYCADGSLGTYNIRKFNSMGGRHFVVSQSCKELKDVFKKALFNDYDYRLLSDDTPITIAELEALDPTLSKKDPLFNDFAYKIVKADVYPDLGSYDVKRDSNGKPVKDKDGNFIKIKTKDKIDQYLIMTFSRKLQAYQRAVRAGQIERAKQLIATTPNPEDIKKTPNDIRRFIKTVRTNSKGETVKVNYVIDEQRIIDEEKYDGYSCIATNLVCSVKKIVEISHRRYKIEYCFRIMKHNLKSRPIYHRLEKRIRAHFLICYTALLVERLLEVKLDQIGCHVTPDNLQKTLKLMTVNEDKGMYTATYKAGKVMRSLEKLTGLGLDYKYNFASTLNRRIRPLLK